MDQSHSDGLVHLDASTFQKPLGLLAEVLAQKLYREAPKMIPAPHFVAVDLFVLIRKAMRTYDLLCYLNADETRLDLPSHLASLEVSRKLLTELLHLRPTS